MNSLKDFLNQSAQPTPNLAVFERQGNEVSGWIKKGLERRKENLEAKLEKLNQEIKERTGRDLGATFLSDG